ncbi:hypothetical protein [Arthrobacter sp. B2a2-09]|uniref:hypothetical protein n=1 Tax=Arthrobacter sp. B2a2-09 TaxID=2952822 RepID=UPI0022CD6782|nr:hypothetical protein [Arthrobacter sp. B2a2-09]
MQQVERSRRASATEPDAQAADASAKDIGAGQAQQEFFRPRHRPIHTDREQELLPEINQQYAARTRAIPPRRCL